LALFWGLTGKNAGKSGVFVSFVYGGLYNNPKFAEDPVRDVYKNTRSIQAV